MTQEEQDRGRREQEKQDRGNTRLYLSCSRGHRWECDASGHPLLRAYHELMVGAACPSRLRWDAATMKVIRCRRKLYQERRSAPSPRAEMDHSERS